MTQQPQQLRAPVSVNPNAPNPLTECQSGSLRLNPNKGLCGR